MLFGSLFSTLSFAKLSVGEEMAASLSFLAQALFLPVTYGKARHQSSKVAIQRNTRVCWRFQGQSSKNSVD